MGVAQRHPGIDPVALLERRRHLDPRRTRGAQRAHQLLALLLLAAWLVHDTSPTSCGRHSIGGFRAWQLDATRSGRPIQASEEVPHPVRTHEVAITQGGLPRARPAL
ncbi:MAG: hypothetical protein ACRDRS_04315 [Pseudonocardiaceae bacterium]